MTPARTLAADLRALSTVARCAHGATAIFPAANARLRALLEAKMTPYDQILTTTRQIVARHADRATCDVAEDAALADLGLDSLAQMEIVLDLEEALAISIPDAALDTLTSVKALATESARQRGVL